MAGVIVRVVGGPCRGQLFEFEEAEISHGDIRSLPFRAAPVEVQLLGDHADKVIPIDNRADYQLWLLRFPHRQQWYAVPQGWGYFEIWEELWSDYGR